MAEWLLSLGAIVIGVSLLPNTTPSLFNQLRLKRRVEHHIVDIRDADSMAKLVAETQPDKVFHLAAQPLVRQSYETPVETFEANVMGTIHVLEAIRRLEKQCEAVMITTDKCYENLERTQPYAESDPMGGHDPYSASKGATELAISSYRRSFFPPEEYGRKHGVSVASARAGNVIGGGDWADDRIVPDCIRAIAKDEPIHVRNPNATRPWQHVLEPLGGYLKLGIELEQADTLEHRQQVCSGFNFGPDPESNRPVRDLVEKVVACWKGEWKDSSGGDAPHEAKLLNLAIGKAERLLNWKPVWDFDEGVAHTVEWYRMAHEDPSSASDVTQGHIAAYTQAYHRNEV